MKTLCVVILAAMMVMVTSRARYPKKPESPQQGMMHLRLLQRKFANELAVRVPPINRKEK